MTRVITKTLVRSAAAPRALALGATLAAALLAGCPDPAQRRPDAPQKGAAPMMMTSARPVKMTEGPSIRPSAALLDWLQKNARGAAGKKRRFRLPVVARFEDEHRLAIGAAHIGTGEGALGADAIALALDDTGMANPLLDALTQRCPKGQASCALWLEGYWGPLLDAPMPEFGAPSADGEKRWPFAVLQVHEVIPAGQGGDARALVEE